MSPTPSRALRVVIVCFFLLSGCTALVYQVVWMRMIGLLVGHSVVAAATVVASFMAGLGIGARLGGAYAERVRTPLAAYGLLEVFVGGFALLSPSLLSLLQPLGGGGVALPLVAGVAILPPTIAMGATLPLLTRWYAREAATLGRDMGSLYAVNTTGALLGAGGAGFLALPFLGQPTTLLLAASVNIGVGILAALLGSRLPVAAVASRAEEQPTSAPGAIFLAFALSGCAAMIDQIAWNRSFGLFTGSTTYAFSLIVCAFITGLAVGGHVFARVVDRTRDHRSLLAFVNIGIALTTAILIPVLGLLPYLLLEPLAARADSFLATQSFVFGVLFALIFLPTLLMGGTYAVATRALAPEPASAPVQIGRAYAYNTAGAIAGSLVAAFVLIPSVHIQGSLWLGVTCNLAAAAVLLAPRRAAAGLLPVLGLLGLVGSSAWDPRIMNLAPHMYGRDLVADPEALSAALDGGSIVFHEEGVSANVTVIQRETGERVLRINGKTDASTYEDRLTQGMLGVLPALVSPEHRDVFVVGLGSGMTVASIVDQPVEEVVVYELLPEVVRGARSFGPLIGEPLDDPRLDLHVGDGRHALRYTTRRYDVVASQPTNLFVSGMATLFTAEAFTEMRSRLRPEGMALVWLQGYLLHDADFRTVIRTFQRVFPESHLWTAGPFDFLLTGHPAPLALEPEAVQARIARMGARSRDWTGLREAADLQRHYLLGPEALARLAGEGPIHGDADPTLEFSAPRALYGGEGRLDARRLVSLRAPVPGIAGARLDAVRAVDDAVLGSDAEKLERALAEDPLHPAGRRRLALLLHQRANERGAAGALDAAEADARRVVALEPTALPGWKLLAQVLVMRGAPDEALAALEEARRMQPWNPFAHLALAALADRVGRTDLANAAREAAEEVDPATP